MKIIRNKFKLVLVVITSLLLFTFNDIVFAKDMEFVKYVDSFEKLEKEINDKDVREIIITKDIKLEKAIIVNRSVDIKSNNKNTLETVSNRHFKVNKSGDLKISNLILSGDEKLGGIDNKGNLEIENSEIINNNYSIGGAIKNTGDIKFYGDIIFKYNKASEKGGALYNTGNIISSSKSNIKFQNNQAVEGGALYNTGNLEFSGTSNFSHNNSLENGGGIYNTGRVASSATKFENNISKKGAAIYNIKNPKIFNSGLLQLVAQYENNIGSDGLDDKNGVYDTKNTEENKIVYIEFNANGGIFKSNEIFKNINIKAGSKINEPENPTRENYVFDGWYLEKEFKNNFDFNKPVNDDLVLVAKWAENKTKQYEVKFESNNGTLVDSQTVNENETINKPEKPTRENYKFLGWYENRDFAGEEFDFTLPITKDIKLYAKWEINKYNLVFTNVENEKDSILIKEYGDTIGVFPKAKNINGKEFKYWEDEYKNRVFEDTIITKNMNLYPVYIDLVNVIFNANGGIFEDNSEIKNIVIESGKKIEKEIIPIRENYKFLGWYEDKDFTTAFDINNYIEKDIILYGKWEKLSNDPIDPTEPTDSTDPTNPTDPTDTDEIDGTNPTTPSSNETDNPTDEKNNEVSVQLEVLTELKEGQLKDEQFTFELVNENSDSIQKAKNNKSGQVVFNEISYIDQGEYNYKIKELNDKQSNIIYDEKEVNIKVEITEKENVLQAQVDYIGEDNIPIFVNTIKTDNENNLKETLDIDTVILANGTKYTDVLTATVLGNEKKAPILLSTVNEVNSKTKAEIKRLNPKEVIISGGENSVSEKNKIELEKEGYEVRRISGIDRYGTAEEIAKEVRALTGVKDEIMLVDGTNFPDVITLSPYASNKHTPILLTEPNSLNNTTKKALKEFEIEEITIGGEKDSVSKKIEKFLKADYKVSRIGGKDRYETASLIAKEVRKQTGNKDDLILVDGTDFPDGITISSLANKYQSPIHLTNPKELTKVTSKDIKDFGIKNITIGGGGNSVSKAIENELKSQEIVTNRIAGIDRYVTAVEISKEFTK